MKLGALRRLRYGDAVGSLFFAMHGFAVSSLGFLCVGVDGGLCGSCKKGDSMCAGNSPCLRWEI